MIAGKDNYSFFTTEIVGGSGLVVDESDCRSNGPGSLIQSPGGYIAVSLGKRLSQWAIFLDKDILKPEVQFALTQILYKWT